MKEKSNVHIKGLPKRSLYDEKLEMKITNLPPNERVRLELSSDSKRYGDSYVVYKSDGQGKVDLTEDRPREGDYKGVKPMGLFLYRSEVNPDVEDNPDSEKFLFSVKIHEEIVAQKRFERVIRTDDVERIEIEREDLEGVLFEPKGPGPHPAVVRLSGSEGKCPTGKITKLLASKGYAVLALAIYGENGLPDELMDVPVEYFEDAVEWLSSRDSIQEEPIAVIGSSKGGELALLLGSKIEKLKTVITYVPSGVVFQGIQESFKKPSSSWSHGGEPLPFVDLSFLESMVQFFRLFILRKPIVWRKSYTKGLKSSDEENLKKATIPVEDIDGPILFISGGDDKMWDSRKLSEISVKRLKESGYDYKYKHLNFEDAGHAISCPYVPVKGREIADSGNMKMSLGGGPDAYRKSDRSSWDEVLKFLEERLNLTS